MSGRATLATARFRFATAATRISEIRTSAARAGTVEASSDARAGATAAVADSLTLAPVSRYPEGDASFGWDERLRTACETVRRDGRARFDARGRAHGLASARSRGRGPEARADRGLRGDPARARRDRDRLERLPDGQVGRAPGEPVQPLDQVPRPGRPGDDAERPAAPLRHEHVRVLAPGEGRG